MRHAEVRHADALHQALLLGFLEREPVVDALLRIHGPVNEVEVGVRPQLLHRRLDVLQHHVVRVGLPPALGFRPDLGRDMDLVARHARVLDRASDVGLVLVEPGRVDVAVANFNCFLDDVVRDGAGRRVVHAEAHRRYGVAVAQRDARVGDCAGL